MTAVEVAAPAPVTTDPCPALPRWALVGTAVAVTVAWATAVWASSHVHADPALHRAALFIHLVSLVLGFGSVLALDCVALRWLLGRQTTHQLSVFAGALQVPIWVGLAGLVGSGLFLGADVSRTLTRVKLALVLMVALNGVQALDIHQRIARVEGVPRRRLVARAIASAFVSQAGWWGAMLIGLLNSQRP